MNINDYISEHPRFTDVPGPIMNQNQYSSVDYWYGPYNSLSDALSVIPKALRGLGLTVGIIENEEVVEYQWKKGIEDDNLEKKIEELNLTISSDTVSYSLEEGQNIVLTFQVDGRAIVSKGYVYQLVGTSEIFLQEITNIVKGTQNTIILSPPQMSGIYNYRIKVIDTSGYAGKTSGGVDYIQYEIKYGGISVNYNLTNIESIQIKNIYSLEGQYFTCNISVRDNTFDVTGIYLSDKDSINIQLPAYSNISDEVGSTNYIGFKYYKFSNITPLDGKFCYIKIEYTENGVQQTLYRELFTILKVSSLELIPQTGTKNYYSGFADYYTFKLQSGVSPLSVRFIQAQDSDFTFESATISTYTNYSLRIIPKNVKSEAILKINYIFTINNIEYNGTFSETLGSIISIPEKEYFTPQEGDSRLLNKFIEADENDLSDGTQYYKIIEETTTSSPYNTASFIVDLYCKINQVNNKTLKYLRILQGNIEIGYITEDEISCRGIVTDTPLNRWVQISLGYNLFEQITRGQTEYNSKYYAIYIDGMVVKNIPIDGVNVQELSYGSPITIELSNGILVQKCFTYYRNDSNTQISPLASMYSIPYTNYLAYNPTFEEPSDLPVLKLMRISSPTERLHYFNLLKTVNEDVKFLTTFGTIGLKKADSMGEYDANYDSVNPPVESTATLFRQGVNIKKPAQKEYTVLCRGQWMNGNSLQECIIEAHTQGTSTLQYSVPNFKFTFWRVVTVNGQETLERFYPQFIEKSGGEYYQESIYTAKADFMDSSHLNNTPTCNFYNNLIQSLITDNTNFSSFTGSPSARNGGIDAIMGFPIVLQISDSAESFSDESSFINIGSFMLNVDKTGNSLGFEVQENGETLSCISFEGTSNDNEHGAAGRFIKNFNDVDYYENEAAIEASALEVTTALAAANKKLDLESEINGVKVRNHPYVRWCEFLSDGLEYRYPDSDLYKESNGNLTKIMKVKDFKKLYKMWSWVAQSDEYDLEAYRTGFVQHFNLEYCMLYFINLMIFAQTDNLGKNAMFDSWDGEIWYPRPYDLDSQAGLDNNGNDNIAPFVEIKPEFSLNYDSNYTQEELAANFLLQSSTIKYGSQYLDRYHYSSNTSKLWINFYKNFKSNIESFYLNLRRNANYSPESIIQLCENSLINKLGVFQYNQDFSNKYLGTAEQTFAYGNRWDKFKKWINQRFAFCDSYFGASTATTYDAISSFTYEIEVESPQYVIQTYQANSVVKFVLDKATFSAGSSAATKTTLRVNQSSVLNTDLFKYVTYSGSETQNYIKLLSLDVSGNLNLRGIESVVGNQLSNLRNLNISKSGVTTLNVPQNLKILTAKEVTLNTVNFIDNSLIEEIDFTDSTINGNVSFSQLPNLKKLDLTNCTLNGTITLANIASLEELIITDTKFRGQIVIQDGINIREFDFSGLSINDITFSGSNLNIKTLNFSETTFGQTTINLNAVSQNIEKLYFNNCHVLEYIQLSEGLSFENLKEFNISESSIKALGNNSEYFDCSYFENLSTLKKNNSTVFNFSSTKLVDIRNLVWNGSGLRLFENCFNLTSISGVLNLTTTISYMFYRCKVLANIPTINIDSSVTLAEYTFAEANSLTYANIESIIRKCTNVTSFERACWCTKFVDNTTINLTRLFENNNVVINIDFMFCPNRYGSGTSIQSATNNLKLSGMLPESIKSAVRTFAQINTLEVPYNIFENASGLENIYGMFINSTITFVAGGNQDLRPTYIDTNDTVQHYTNAINSDFFYNKGTNKLNTISVLFAGTNVQIIDTNVFQNLEELTNCVCVFRKASPQSFSQELNIDSLWVHNPKIQDVSGCFENVKNVYCNALNFHQNINSTKTVNISGLFGLTSFQNDSSIINISIKDIIPKITTNSYYNRDSSNSDNCGVFQNRKVHIIDSDSSIFSKFSSQCRKLFSGAQLYISNNVTTFDLSNVVSYASEMFRETIIYKYNEENSYSNSDRYFVDILMPTNCHTYIRMFQDSSVLKSLPTLRSVSTSRCDYMFQSAIINSSEVEIPSNYFQICKANISNLTNMFCNNIYITSLEYDQNCGLFQDCIKLAAVKNMFYGAHFLHKGIPNNLFGSTNIPGLTSLEGMFAYTLILQDINDGIVKQMDANTIAPLTKLQTVQGMFEGNRYQGQAPEGYGNFRNQVLNADNELVYVINPNTFASSNNLQVITNLFKNTSINIPFKFLRFSYAQEAFYDTSMTEIDPIFISDTYISGVLNAQRMFYNPRSNSRSVQNLGIFVNNLKSRSSAKINNIAGGLSNEDVDSNLKQTISSYTYIGGFGIGGNRIYQQ